MDQRIHRSGEDARPLQCGARTGEPRESYDAARRNRSVGRSPVIGLAIPSRKFEEFDVWSGERESLAKGACSLPGVRAMDKYLARLDDIRRNLKTFAAGLAGCRNKRDL